MSQEGCRWFYYTYFMSKYGISFVCRDDFLMALKDHQVLVLVGETGSGELIRH